MKSEQILQSLLTLDPDNKDHWTQNGQPLLSAVGEGVTRSQILDVAPLFSRDNPILPEAEVQSELTDEEVVETLEDKLTEIELKREEANNILVAAQVKKTEAENKIKEAVAVLEELTREEKTLDPRSDTEINQDLLKASFAERLRRAGAQTQARKLLEQAGLVNELKSLAVSPVDRAIAERIVMERRKRAGKK
jgi:hypothetical protein